MSRPATVGPSAYWYLTRSTGIVSLVLLTASVTLGVIGFNRWSSARWPRFVLGSLHRNVSLLAMTFLLAHILTAVLDGFAPIAPIDALVPFTGTYRPLWLGLGALAFDLLAAVVLTSFWRRRLGYGTWRATHWLSYASWPVALLHGLGTGSDIKSTWMLTLSLACLLAVVVAVAVRTIAQAGIRGAALGATAIFSLFLALWLPWGPLGHGWASRAGTPASLLKDSHR